jgi:hypothetical protein
VTKPLVTLMMCLGALAANAQPVYRCGSEYSQSPCPQANVVDAADARTEAQRAEARRVAADEKRLGAQMEHDRVAMQAAQKPGGAASLSGAPPPPKHAEHTRAKKLKLKKDKKPAKPG